MKKYVKSDINLIHAKLCSFKDDIYFFDEIVYHYMKEQLDILRYGISNNNLSDIQSSYNTIKEIISNAYDRLSDMDKKIDEINKEI